MNLLGGRRAAVVAGAASLATMAFASSALAAPTTIPVTATGIRVIAAPGTQNNVSIDYRVYDQGNDGYHVDAQYITDTAGLSVV